MADELTWETGEDVDGAPVVIAGDHADDDATYVDDLFKGPSGPPVPAELPRDDEPTLPATVPARRNNRLLARTATYSDNVDAIMVLPEDRSRVALTIASSTVSCYFADARDTLYGPGRSNAFLILAGATLQIPDYTGPVYLAPTGDGSGNWTYSVLAVTE